MEDKNKKIAVVALIFALLALTQAQAITNVTMNLIAGSGINISQSGDNYTISATGMGASDNTKINKTGDTVVHDFMLISSDTITMYPENGFYVETMTDLFTIHDDMQYSHNGVPIFSTFGDTFNHYTDIDLQGQNLLNCGNCLINSSILNIASNTTLGDTSSHTPGWSNVLFFFKFKNSGETKNLSNIYLNAYSSTSSNIHFAFYFENGSGKPSYLLFNTSNYTLSNAGQNKFATSTYQLNSSQDYWLAMQIYNGSSDLYYKSGGSTAYYYSTAYSSFPPLVNTTLTSYSNAPNINLEGMVSISFLQSIQNICKNLPSLCI